MRKIIIACFFIFLSCFNPVTAQDLSPDYTPYFPDYPPLTSKGMMEWTCIIGLNYPDGFC